MESVYILGNLNIDAIIGVFPNWPQVGLEVTGDFFDFRYAGAAGNNALALKNLGFDVHVISSVGDDEFGENFFNKFRNMGVDLSKCKKSKKRTGISIGISFTNSERTFFTFLGALEDMTNDFFSENLRGVEKSWIVICGFNLIPSLQSNEFIEIIRSTKLRKNKILFDPGWPPQGWNKKMKEQALQLAILSDWFVPNMNEALAISEKNSVEESVKYFKSKGIQNCVIKLGEKGAYGFSYEGRTVSSAFKLGKIKDTVGAGDLFNAALLKGLSMKWEKGKAVKFASFYASLGITRSGERRYPTFEEAYFNFLKADHLMTE